MNARRALADVARGAVPADLVLTNGRIFDVLSSDLVEGDLAILGDRIAGIGRFDGLQQLDVRGRVILPGFIDAGAVLEPSHLSLEEYARLVSCHGTTATIFDFRTIAAVQGMRGLADLLEQGQCAATDVFCALPLACGPWWDAAPGRFERLEPTHLSLPGLVARGGDLAGRCLLASGGAALETNADDVYLPAVVEAAGVSDAEAAALAALGAAADRHWQSPREALAKLRQGLWLLAAEGTLASSAANLHWLSRATRLDRCCLVSGGCTAADLLQEGHLDAALRRLVQAGVAAGDALRLVTTQPATLFALRDRGALLPGYRADVVVVDDLRRFAVNLVIKGGRPVARQGASLLPEPAVRAASGEPSMRPALIVPDQLAVRGHSGHCRVIGLEESGATVARFCSPKWEEGQLCADVDQDLCKVAVFDRHTASGAVGLGFVQGLNMRAGAICCSFAGPGAGLIVAGVDDASMLAALHQVVVDGGGMAVARDGQVTASLPLPYAGLLSPLPATEVVSATRRLDEAAWELECDAAHPFLALASLADTRTGDLRLTERGLVDVVQQRLTSLQP